MKILVFSDSHGVLEPMLALAADYSPQLIIHLGDGAGDIKRLKKELPDTPVINVRGNCDSLSTLPEREITELCGHRLFLTHGHRYNVKFGTDSLLTNAVCAGADIVMYGHTHIPDCRLENGLLILNPGSIGFNRSYALLELKENETPGAELLQY